jgi:hypothetical protein
LSPLRSWLNLRSSWRNSRHYEQKGRGGFTSAFFVRAERKIKVKLWKPVFFALTFGFKSDNIMDAETTKADLRLTFGSGTETGNRTD